MTTLLLVVVALLAFVVAVTAYGPLALVALMVYVAIGTRLVVAALEVRD